MVAVPGPCCAVAGPTTGAISAAEAIRRRLDADLTAAPHPAATHVAESHGAAASPRFLTRESPAFTPTEISRAQALLDLCETPARS
ncbi:MAG: hypothetical protein ABW046_14600 [Actinoplanes sp.]